MQSWVHELFQALDEEDLRTFSTYLSEDCTFVFGNRDPVEGLENVRDFVDGFYRAIEGTQHHLDEIYRSPGRVVVRGTVTYLQRDGERKSFPFANIFELDNEQITQYQIYVDNHELQLDNSPQSV